MQWLPLIPKLIQVFLYDRARETNLSGHITLLAPYYPDLKVKERGPSTLWLLSRRAVQNTAYSSECHSFGENNLLDSKSPHLCVLKYHSSEVEIISQIPTSLMFIFYSGKLVDCFGWKLACTNKKKLNLAC